MAKVLVTGGRGFVGSNLVRELESRGHEVWVCDLMHCERVIYAVMSANIGKLKGSLRSISLTMFIMRLRSMVDGTAKIIMKIFGLQMLLEQRILLEYKRRSALE